MTSKEEVAKPKSLTLYFPVSFVFRRRQTSNSSITEGAEKAKISPSPRTSPTVASFLLITTPRSLLRDLEKKEEGKKKKEEPLVLPLEGKRRGSKGSREPIS